MNTLGIIGIAFLAALSGFTLGVRLTIRRYRRVLRNRPRIWIEPPPAEELADDV